MTGMEELWPRACDLHPEFHSLATHTKQPLSCASTAIPERQGLWSSRQHRNYLQSTSGCFLCAPTHSRTHPLPSVKEPTYDDVILVAALLNNTACTLGRGGQSPHSEQQCSLIGAAKVVSEQTTLTRTEGAQRPESSTVGTRLRRHVHDLHGAGYSIHGSFAIIEELPPRSPSIRPGSLHSDSAVTNWLEVLRVLHHVWSSTSPSFKEHEVLLRQVTRQKVPVPWAGESLKQRGNNRRRQQGGYRPWTLDKEGCSKRIGKKQTNWTNRTQ